MLNFLSIGYLVITFCSGERRWYLLWQTFDPNNPAFVVQQNLDVFLLWIFTDIGGASNNFRGTETTVVTFYVGVQASSVKWGSAPSNKKVLPTSQKIHSSDKWLLELKDVQRLHISDSSTLWANAFQQHVCQLRIRDESIMA